MHKLYERLKDNLKIGHKYTFWMYDCFGAGMYRKINLQKIELISCTSAIQAIAISFIEKGEEYAKRITIQSESTPLIVWDGWNEPDRGKDYLPFSFKHIEKAKKEIKKKPLILEENHLRMDERKRAIKKQNKQR